jgi:hypothetical protein
VVDMARRENIAIPVPSQAKIRRQEELIALQTSRRVCLQFLLKISIDNTKGQEPRLKERVGYRTSEIQKRVLTVRKIDRLLPQHLQLNGSECILGLSYSPQS